MLSSTIYSHLFWICCHYGVDSELVYAKLYTYTHSQLMQTINQTTFTWNPGRRKKVHMRLCHTFCILKGIQTFTGDGGCGVDWDCQIVCLWIPQSTLDINMWNTIREHCQGHVYVIIGQELMSQDSKYTIHPCTVILALFPHTMISNLWQAAKDPDSNVQLFFFKQFCILEKELLMFAYLTNRECF